MSPYEIHIFNPLNLRNKGLLYPVIHPAAIAPTEFAEEPGQMYYHTEPGNEGFWGYFGGSINAWKEFAVADETYWARVTGANPYLLPKTTGDDVFLPTYDKLIFGNYGVEVGDIYWDGDGSALIINSDQDIYIEGQISNSDINFVINSFTQARITNSGFGLTNSANASVNFIDYSIVGGGAGLSDLDTSMATSKAIKEYVDLISGIYWSRNDLTPGSEYLYPTNIDKVIIGTDGTIIPKGMLAVGGDIQLLEGANRTIYVDIRGDAGVSYDLTIKAGAAYTSVLSGGNLILRGGTGGATSGAPQGGDVIIYGGDGDAYGDIILAFDGVEQRGYVGIGLAVPQCLLNVNGEFGLTNAGDVAVDTIETILTNDHTHIPTSGAVKQIFDDMGEPGGFVDRTSSSISFDDVKMQFTISPVGLEFVFYSGGNRFVKNSADKIDITDSEGMWYIYYDENGNLQATQTFSEAIITTYAFIAALYWDFGNNQAIYIGDERHGVTMDHDTHLRLHLTDGTRYVDGLALGDFTIGNGDLDAHAQFGFQTGRIVDEDLFHIIEGEIAPATIPIFYLEGTSAYWRRIDATTFPLTTIGTGRMAWNNEGGGNWGLTEVTNGRYALMHYFATNDINLGLIGVVGQNEYLTIADAREGAYIEMPNLVLEGLPFVEFKAIGTVIFQTSDSYGNTVKSRVVPTDTGDYWIDWRFDKFYSGAGGNTAISDHGLLTGLDDDDHLQYLLLAGRIGGQTVYGSNTTGENLILYSNNVSGGYVDLKSNTRVASNQYIQFGDTEKGTIKYISSTDIVEFYFRTDFHLIQFDETLEQNVMRTDSAGNITIFDDYNVRIDSMFYLADGTVGINQTLDSVAGIDATSTDAQIATAKAIYNLVSGVGTYWSRDDLNGYLYPTTLTDFVGIGINNPAYELQIDGNISLGVGTDYTKAIYFGNARTIHLKGTTNFFVGPSSGNLTLTGTGNLAIGWNTLSNLTSGSSNVAIGTSALPAITNSSSNVVIGFGGAQSAIADTNNNTLVGHNVSGALNGGDENSAFGYRALDSVVTGNRNTVVGAYAGLLVTGSGNVMIGWKAGYYETGSSKLYIDNTDTTTPLIWGDFVADKVIIYGYLQLGATAGLDEDVNAIIGSGDTWVSDDNTLATTAAIDAAIGGVSQYWSRNTVSDPYLYTTTVNDDVKLDRDFYVGRDPYFTGLTEANANYVLNYNDVTGKITYYTNPHKTMTTNAINSAGWWRIASCEHLGTVGSGNAGFIYFWWRKSGTYYGTLVLQPLITYYGLDLNLNVIAYEVGNLSGSNKGITKVRIVHEENSNLGPAYLEVYSDSALDDMDYWSWDIRNWEFQTATAGSIPTDWETDEIDLVYGMGTNKSLYSGEDLILRGIPNATKTNVLYYDTTDKKVYYGTASTGSSLWTEKGSDIYRNSYVGIGDFGTPTIDTRLHLIDNSKYIKFSHTGTQAVINAEDKMIFQLNGSDIVTLETALVTVSQDLKIPINKKLYFGNEDTNGSWRIYDDGLGHLVIEQRIAGTWTFAGKFTSN